MAKVTIKLPTLDKISRKGIVTSGFQNKLGKTIVSEIKSRIKTGRSPVAKAGRYPGYKADRSGDRKNPSFYPNSVKKKFPRKQRRPVNLTLSGAMLKELTWGMTKGGVKIGMLKASKRIKDIFESHNEGTNESRGVPRRPILPTGKGEKFTASIVRRIRSLYLARVRQVIRK